jgi:hypothetical protein
VNSKEVIPSDVKRLSKSGRLSVKRMSKSRFYELYQDYVCGCVLRIARELFALLPIEMVIVNAVVNALETRSGYLEKQPSYVGEQPILSVAIPRKMLEELNFEALDPSDSMSNFAHRMAFKKTQGFGTVEALSAPDLQTIMFYVFPRYCCRCLGPSECTIEVDSQHDRISVPVCKKCFDTVSSYRAFRRHIKVSLYLFALCTLAVALFNEQSDLLLPAWICAFLSKYLFVLMKFLTEPARFDKYGMLKFKNEEYQSLFDQANLYQVPL